MAGQENPPEEEDAESCSSIGDSEGEEEEGGDVMIILVHLPMESAPRRAQLRRPAKVERLKRALQRFCRLEEQVLWRRGGAVPDEEELEEGQELRLLSREERLVLEFLPARIHCLLDFGALVDVVLDLDRPAVFHERADDGSLRKQTSKADRISAAELEALCQHRLLGAWTSDNRSGIVGTLHRASRMLDPTNGKTLGLTLRIARARFGATEQMRDLMKDRCSILLVGAPGTGKTTLLREIARVQSDEFQRRVFVVDTSSELAGFGQEAHWAVGRLTRRMKVGDRGDQHERMVEAVQNHTPEVLLIDEIGAEPEVQAAMSIASRGICLIATAHATDLKQAVWNPVLKPLFGDMETAPVSDQAAKLMYGGRKFVTQRKYPCQFQKLIEVHSSGEPTIHRDLQRSVDHILLECPEGSERQEGWQARGWEQWSEEPGRDPLQEWDPWREAAQLRHGRWQEGWRQQGWGQQW